MKILIVDDENLSLMRLNRLLTEAGNHIILSAKSSSEAISILEKNPDIHIAFIDIKMPDMSGIELAYKILTKNESIFIVFQTAYEEYALEAFKVGAIDYLLKPYTVEDIKRVLDRIDKFRESKNRIKFMIKTVQGEYRMLSPEDIYYIKAELKDSLIRIYNDYIYYPLSISKFEERLRNYGFFRVHKSYLINIGKLEKIRRVQQSKLIFKFSGIDDTVTSSKEGAKLFRERFGEISFRENTKF
ncbi:MAG: LytTR family DNA-binding domain-containing protein [Thermodesulfovibrio sp.]|nr:LytTR family DNA-binding domain-containing protein [Thermodesulfovibrio sp.]